MLKHTLFVFAVMLANITTAQAETNIHQHHNHHDQHHKSGHIMTAGSHAPIGVMNDHMMHKGEYMTSYRYMHMGMDGNRKGDSSISNNTIATTEPNRFSGTAGQPPTLRVVPTKMDMTMHMLGGMYAPSDSVTLMVMANYIEKDMDHLTYQGMMGTNILGTFKTKSSGWGDTKLTSLIRLYEDRVHHLHIGTSLSIPTGSIKQSGIVLAPSGMTPRLRLPYAMQLGTGTYDLHPSITYTGQLGAAHWGTQYNAEIRLESENDEGYSWGNKHSLSTWYSYDWKDWASTSARLTATTQDSIDGIDANILAPVQTADPDNYGGNTVEIGLGINLLNSDGHRLGIEANIPIYRNLNGIQLEKDFNLTIGWKKTF